ncbi:hypothetical protein E2K80_15810 [Rhodophyticola sp. CCM32]|uniref:hypothetical protein n=1 Tax=Rhodophyticola sp. CCM32 TaxID=2916397 RepID=UPI00107F7070|nr:hypothetical protein [Rhodophyticola sp. CCM32]QBY02013.1 hypothetical protein E2K80_15810 [Rhodophyticola sp. CCM32]
MEQSVTVLRVEESARFNPDRLEQLCAELGEVQAESEVAEALATIGILLEEIEPLDGTSSDRALARPLSQLIAASDKIGMASLARVARDAELSRAKQDPVALAATLARLQRVGERSILAIWDLEDLSG